MIQRPPRSTLLPYTALFLSQARLRARRAYRVAGIRVLPGRSISTAVQQRSLHHPVRLLESLPAGGLDRKSTRLNSSHANISYAVFCLNKNENYLSSTVLTLL